MKTNNYDRVAPFYDVLSRMVFFKSQVNAQVQQLSYIPKGANILIVGGGTGWVLEKIAESHVDGLRITYVEISAQMLAKARRRNHGQHKVNFIHSGIEEYTFESTFDVVITAFLFDNFSETRAIKIFNRLDVFLNEGGLWLYADFKSGHKERFAWKNLMLKLMYLFFRKLAHVEATQLMEVEGLFMAKNYQIRNRKGYYGGFIESIIFRKSGNLPTFI